jgi:hypothetical protein
MTTAFSSQLNTPHKHLHCTDTCICNNNWLLVTVCTIILFRIAKLLDFAFLTRKYHHNTLMLIGIFLFHIELPIRPANYARSSGNILYIS